MFMRLSPVTVLVYAKINLILKAKLLMLNEFRCQASKAWSTWVSTLKILTRTYCKKFVWWSEAACWLMGALGPAAYQCWPLSLWFVMWTVATIRICCFFWLCSRVRLLTRPTSQTSEWPMFQHTTQPQLIPGSAWCGRSPNNYIGYTLPHTISQRDNCVYFRSKCGMFYQSSLKLMYCGALSSIVEIGPTYRRGSDAAELLCFPIDADRSPQGSAEVCRPCRFLLEIILPLVSSRFLPINSRSPSDIQSSKLFSGCLDTFSYKHVKGTQEHTKQPQCRQTKGSQPFQRFDKRRLFFDNCSHYRQDRVGGDSK